VSTFAPPPQQQRNPIFALTAYAKNERADLSQADRNDFRHLTALLVEALREGNTTMSKVAESIRRGQCLSVAHDLSSVCSSWSVLFFAPRTKRVRWARHPFTRCTADAILRFAGSDGSEGTDTGGG
jgi:hypothetical protein